MLDILNKGVEKSWTCYFLEEGDVYYGENKEKATIVFVVEGNVSVSASRFENRIVQSGEIFLIPQGCLYHTEIIEKSHLIACHFNLTTLLSSIAIPKGLIDIHKKIEYNFNILKATSLIHDFLVLAEKYVCAKIESDKLFELKRLELFLLLFESYSLEEIAGFLHPIINEDILFEEFIINNHLQVSSIKELAGLFNYSTSGFIKKFQRYFNESPHKWIARKKAERIYFEITCGVLSLQEISHKYKFSSYSRFVDFCKAHFGHPPTAIYKESNQIDFQNN